MHGTLATRLSRQRRVVRYTGRSKSLSDISRHGKLAKILPLQWKRNRPSNLLNSKKGNPRSRARTPLPATAVLSKIRKMVTERLRPHRGWRGLTTLARPAGVLGSG